MQRNPRGRKLIQELFLAKSRRRRELARLPFEEKIFILLQLQKWAAGVPRVGKGVKRRPWAVKV